VDSNLPTPANEPRSARVSGPTRHRPRHGRFPANSSSARTPPGASCVSTAPVEILYVPKACGSAWASARCWHEGCSRLPALQASAAKCQQDRNYGDPFGPKAGRGRPPVPRGLSVDPVTRHRSRKTPAPLDERRFRPGGAPRTADASPGPPAVRGQPRRRGGRSGGQPCDIFAMRCSISSFDSCSITAQIVHWLPPMSATVALRYP